MELDTIRKQLDKLDQSLKYIVLLRTSLAILVGKVKAEKNLPVYQAGREQAIFDSIKDFCVQTGVNEDLLTQIYKDLIAESVRIEENLPQYLPQSGEAGMAEIEQTLEHSMEALKEFTTLMDTVTDCLKSQGIDGEECFKAISKYNENYLETTK